MSTLSGLSAAELLDLFEKHVNPGWARLDRLMGLTAVEVRAEGSLVWDQDENEYIDLASGISSISMGHRHPRVVRAVQEQLERLAFSTRVLLNENQLLLAQKLSELAPGDLQYCFFTHSGTEAVEGALKLARSATGRTDFIAAQNSFHGKSFGALSATGKDTYRDPFRPLLPGFTHVPFGDAAAVEQALTADTAAVILEPIQGEGGVIIPPDDYLPRVRELSSANGTLLILDEVQTGLGRTGKNFACEHWGVVPDIMTLAKSLGGGVMPLGAIVARKPIFDIFEQHILIHSTTTGGNPLATAAGLAALDVLVEERLGEQAIAKGQLVLERLRDMQKRFDGVFAAIRARGLLIGLELAKPALGGLLYAELFEERVLTVPALNDFSLMRIAPPLNIPEPLLQRGMDGFERALERAVAQVQQLEA